MTECARMRELLLEAEPEELRGSGDTELAIHLRTCPDCSASAGAILRGTEALGRALERPGSPADIDSLLERASSVAPPPFIGSARGGRDATPEAPAGEGTWSRARRWTAWSSLAAAAGLAGLLLLRPDPPSLGTAGRVADHAPPVLEADSAQNVAVFETDNPDITVLWFF